MVEANRTAAIHQRRFEITRRGETGGVLSVNSDLRPNSVATSHPFAPGWIVVSLHLNRNRAVRVLFLLASPGNRLEDPRAKLDLGGKMDIEPPLVQSVVNRKGRSDAWGTRLADTRDRGGGNACGHAPEKRPTIHWCNSQPLAGRRTLELTSCRSCRKVAQERYRK